MTYPYLGHGLHETADRAKKYFEREYGATKFECEAEVEKDLPLRPTWQAVMQGGYRLCIEVRETVLSPTLHAFVTTCAGRGIPVRLWVALPVGNGVISVKDLKEARELGVGVVQVNEDGSAQEFHKPVPLSLFGLRKADQREVPRKRRESIKNAEDAFLGGAPEQGCQLVCQELESVTRRFAQYSYDQKWWKAKALPVLAPKFFNVGSWANMLELLDVHIDVDKVRPKCASFKKAQIAGARQYTDFRNSVSHTPKSLKALQSRDAKLRTM